MPWFFHRLVRAEKRSIQLLVSLFLLEPFDENQGMMVLCSGWWRGLAPLEFLRLDSRGLLIGYSGVRGFLLHPPQYYNPRKHLNITTIAKYGNVVRFVGTRNLGLTFSLASQKLFL